MFSSVDAVSYSLLVTLQKAVLFCLCLMFSSVDMVSYSQLVTLQKAVSCCSCLTFSSVGTLSYSQLITPQKVLLFCLCLKFSSVDTLSYSQLVTPGCVCASVSVRVCVPVLRKVPPNTIVRCISTFTIININPFSSPACKISRLKSARLHARKQQNI